MDVKITCIIIDDEPLGQELIRKYISRLSFLELVAVYDNAIEALGRASSLKPDIIFLDVNMPEMTGIEFLKTFGNQRPHVILATAYSEYAVQGFDYDVADFLLKPITFDRFVKSINKVKDKMHFTTQNQTAPAARVLPPAPGADKYLLIKENKRFLNVAMDDIFFVEGMKDYLKIHTSGKVIITHMTMTKMEELLSSDFLRVNRSYIVRKAAIQAINGNTLEMSNNSEVPVGTRYRDNIRELQEGGTL